MTRYLRLMPQGSIQEVSQHVMMGDPKGTAQQAKYPTSEARVHATATVGLAPTRRNSFGATHTARLADQTFCVRRAQGP